MTPGASFRGEGRPTIKERLTNILVNAGFHLETDFWTQHGDYRKKYWDLAVWGCRASYKGRTYDICSWNTMTAIVKAGGISFDMPAVVADGIDISAHDVTTAEGLATAGEQGRKPREKVG